MTDDVTPDPADDTADETPAGETPAVETPAENAAAPKRRRLLVALLAVLVLGAGGVAFAVTRGGDCPPGNAVLRVAGTTVSQDELARRAEVVQALYGLSPPEDAAKADAYRRELAKSMAMALIVDRDAQRRGIVVADKSVRDALDRYIADTFPEGGRDKFVEAMGAKGVSEADVLGEFRRIQTTFRLLDSAAGPVTVSDADVAAAYDQRKASLVLPEQRKLRHLVVATEAEANAALARLRRGEAFAAVASAVSLDGSTKAQGGDLGTRSAADLQEPFRQAAFAAAVGTPFGPVHTSFGWHVGLVEAVVPGHALSRDEAAAPLRDQLTTERKLAAQRAYVARILAGAHVCYGNRFRPADPTAPPPETPGAPTPPSSRPTP